MIALFCAAAILLTQTPAPASGQTIQEIRVHGNATLPDAEVIRLAGVRVGEPFADVAVAAVEQRLRESGRFDEVRVVKRYRTLEMTGVTLVLLVHEKPGLSASGEPPSVAHRLRSHLMFFPIVNYEDGYGWTYGARTTFAGPPGSRAHLSVPLSWGATRQAALEAERTFSSGPLTRIQGAYGIEQRENPHFDLADRRTGVSVRAERRLFGLVTLGAGAARQAITFGGSHDAVWTTGADAALDTRNDPAYPSDAVLLRAEWSRLHGIGSGDGANSVDMYGLDARGYKRVVRNVVFAARARYDTASGPLPPYDQYLVGGELLRGTHAGLLAGDRRLLWSTELRIPFSSPLDSARVGANVFLDGGAAAPYGTSIKDVRMERGAGAGLFLIASVVRLNLSVAHSLDGRGTRLQFGTGFTF